MVRGSIRLRTDVSDAAAEVCPHGSDRAKGGAEERSHLVCAQLGDNTGPEHARKEHEGELPVTLPARWARRREPGRPRQDVRALRHWLRMPRVEAIHQRVLRRREEVRRGPLHSPRRLRRRHASQLRHRFRVPSLQGDAARNEVHALSRQKLSLDRDATDCTAAGDISGDTAFPVGTTAPPPSSPAALPPSQHVCLQRCLGVSACPAAPSTRPTAGRTRRVNAPMGSRARAAARSARMLRLPDRQLKPSS